MFWRLLNFQILLSSVNTVETKTEKHKNSSAKPFKLFEQENLQSTKLKAQLIYYFNGVYFMSHKCPENSGEKPKQNQEHSRTSFSITQDIYINWGH